jgi:hypothetical protein
VNNAFLVNAGSVASKPIFVTRDQRRGSLGRSYSRPLLDLFLLAQEAINLGPQLVGAGLLPICNRLCMLNKALDQLVLQLRDPGPFFWRKQAPMLTHTLISSEAGLAVLSGNGRV